MATSIATSTARSGISSAKVTVGLLFRGVWPHHASRDLEPGHGRLLRYGGAPQPAMASSTDRFLMCCGLVFIGRTYTKMVRGYGLQQAFITPHCPQQNGMMERLIRSLKEKCVHRQRSESLAHTSRAIGVWIAFYNHRRPHQALGMKTPAAAFGLAA
ncbi:MAG: integrase core domain-containing protein [Pseudomonadota bacterium]